MKFKIGILIISLTTILLSHGDVFSRQTKLCIIGQNHSYQEVENREIIWSDIFNVMSSDYLVYVYSAYCGHCLSIKNLVIGTALCEIEEIYFVTYSSEVVIAQDVENTIGVASVDAIWIRGYPTLLRIYDGILIMNIAGASAISDYLTDLISDKY